MADLHDLTALEQGVLIASGEVSSLELTEHYLARTGMPAISLPLHWTRGGLELTETQGPQATPQASRNSSGDR